jgi:hypothetical protein
LGGKEEIGKREGERNEGGTRRKDGKGRKTEGKRRKES